MGGGPAILAVKPLALARGEDRFNSRRSLARRDGSVHTPWGRA